jgi:hypothetical protein
MGDNEQKKENALALWKILLGLFLLTYFLWYINGGPERWNKKIEGEINKKNIQENLINSKFYLKN